MKLPPEEKAKQLINDYYRTAKNQQEAKEAARKIIVNTIMKKIDEYWSGFIRDEESTSINNHSNLRSAFEELHFLHSVEYEITKQ